MPAAAVYVAAVIGTVAAAVAFHQFVYEPHIAPNIERWAQEIIHGHREARARARRRSQAAAVSMSSVTGDDARSDTGSFRGGSSAVSSDWHRSAHELENLAQREMNEWRQDVYSNGLRKRTGGPMEQSTSSLINGPIQPSFSSGTDAQTPRAHSPVAPGNLPTPHASRPGTPHSVASHSDFNTVFSLETRSASPSMDPSSRMISPFSDAADLPLVHPAASLNLHEFGAIDQSPFADSQSHRDVSAPASVADADFSVVGSPRSDDSHFMVPDMDILSPFSDVALLPPAQPSVYSPPSNASAAAGVRSPMTVTSDDEMFSIASSVSDLGGSDEDMEDEWAHARGAPRV